jgi:hypothetical protein
MILIMKLILFLVYYIYTFHQLTFKKQYLLISSFIMK